MSVNIVLPTLSAWAASRLTGLLESKTQDDFNTTFDATHRSTGNPSPAMNTRHNLLEQSAAGFGEASAVVNIEGQTEVQTGNQGQLSGLVGLFYSSLSDSKFLVLGAPTEERATSSLNLVIEPTEKNPQTHLPIRGYFDPRRVTTVNQTVTTTTDKSSKVELGPAPLEIPPNFGPFGGNFGPGPVRFPQKGPFGGHFGPGPVRLPPTETGAKPETLPGNGAFGVGPVIIPGETIGDTKP
ncbi:hypothetical protein JVU11DRAFT_4351 [Chiua virens]|nr:hypothetical protein JVU11DRAFT_4351 [Chiua virens]